MSVKPYALDTSHIPKALDNVLLKSYPIPPETTVVKGYDFNKGIDYNALLESYASTGFQATNLGLAMDEVNKMLNWRLSQEPLKEDDDITDPEERENTKCTIFLGYTSNMISCGVRETIKFLVQNNLVSCIVTTAGGIEEDFIKCLAPTYIGDFALNGMEMRRKGHNRIGNLIMPNDNYVVFEEWLTPILDKMYEEQEKDGIRWTPSKMIHRLGKEINNEDSVYYWAYKNNIPVFSPAITDGSIGDMLYFHSYKFDEWIRLDIVEDIRELNSLAIRAKKSGMVILGGGVVKHHICNANLMRNGADYTVFINTGNEFDGSDTGARPDEAVSWGKIRYGSSHVKVYTEASLVFPLLVAQTFAKYHFAQLEKKNAPKK
eukprot:CAMPEP_0184350036 /NCGR_PEP_ID=MMETSP1089-20130417/37435_1 /TAXON_ID=38269 ORGANISM="Gloeochaete wittrockiana, Strain SAG46.84" /NCGR_SAMPLE_ID=MMETSP1089 /ASSEMBLY_ACC=CAM_ASM_000445 /LENGTH=374 /DNA_ID=CAMNT_0026682589 /DNA_START=29 /DNA_END=1150 /DNA_ORIENTATION=+